MFPPLVERWRPLATGAAARARAAHGVDLGADLVLAVIQKESSGVVSDRPTIEPNRTLSRGLMQVTPAAAADVGFHTPTQLVVPAVGIEIGTRYLATKLKKYRDVPRALAAYNRGFPEYDQHERFVNQGYVDQVMQFLRAATGGTGGRGGAPPFRWTAGAIVAGMGAIVALAAIAGARGGRRAA
jgi:hypothetical protein